MIRSFIISLLMLINAGAAIAALASQEGLSVMSRQMAEDVVEFAASNSSAKPMHFSFKVYYSYDTALGNSQTETKIFDGTLEPGQSDNNLGSIVEENVQVQSIMILYVTSN